ncbi:hypothetical protein AQUCO_04100109v1 [Aquilegia coerulea]|uniref:Uncharacterized protein n=1 Tax=Aquilegia coerulea TaxID=218851 RepID=A0A2G5CQI9_AQUCA|nr:hypothetical protein AQUCO_04100109v1 [Aquilegia coerulea]
MLMCFCHIFFSSLYLLTYICHIYILAPLSINLILLLFTSTYQFWIDGGNLLVYVLRPSDIVPEVVIHIYTVYSG